MLFNRPETTALVFKELAKAQPRKLLIVADGPRPDRPGEEEKCEAARAVVERIDWDCEVHKNYSDVNLGCKRRVAGGLDWVFGTVDRAIVIEDDVLPHPTFFRFCDELLDRYANDSRVGAICGCNFQDGLRKRQESYYFSRYIHVWGWASWSRAWKAYDVNMSLWPLVRDNGYLNGLIPNDHSLSYWYNILQEVYDGKVDTWDYQWTFSCWAQGMMSIIPGVNLISNIGFGESATHTGAESSVSNMPTEAMQFPLTHPGFMMRDEMADAASDLRWGISPVDYYDNSIIFTKLLRSFVDFLRRGARNEKLLRERGFRGALHAVLKRIRSGV
jgi:hypothetical protein